MKTRYTWQLVTDQGVTVSRLLADDQETGWYIRAQSHPFGYQTILPDGRKTGYRHSDLRKAMAQAEDLYKGSLGEGAYAQRDVSIFIYDETCDDWGYVPDAVADRVRALIDERIGGGVVSRSRVIDVARAAFDLVEQECSTLHPADYRDGWSQGDELPVCEVGMNVEVDGLNASYQTNVTIGGAA